MRKKNSKFFPKIGQIFDFRPTVHGNVSFTWTLNLEPEDQVHLKIESGTYYVDADATSSRIYFTAFLMKASA